MKMKHGVPATFANTPTDLDPVFELQKHLDGFFFTANWLQKTFQIVESLLIPLSKIKQKSHENSGVLGVY